MDWIFILWNIDDNSQNSAYFLRLYTHVGIFKIYLNFILDLSKLRLTCLRFYENGITNAPNYEVHLGEKLLKFYLFS